MAVIASTRPTLIDVANRLDPDGKIAKIAELLTEQNEILEDLTFIEANNGTNHKTTVRTGLSTPTWRMLNYGVQPTKTKTAQIEDATAMLEDYSHVDKALADLNGNTADFRLSEDMGKLESMSQAFADTVFYGSELNQNKFVGLTPRYNTLNPAVPVSRNVIDGGGTGSNNTSIWIVVWGPNTVHGIYPKGSKAGLHHEDKGQQTVTDEAGGLYEAYRTHYKWDGGISVRDWRYAVRIANIDVTTLKEDAATGAKLIDLIVKGIEKIPNLKGGRAGIYMHRDLRTMLRLQMVNAKNVNLSWAEVGGKKVMAFDDVPVRICDALVKNEARVTA